MRRLVPVLTLVVCATVAAAALAAVGDDRADGSDHFRVRVGNEKVTGQIYAWATRADQKATSVATLSINPSISNALTVYVRERAIASVTKGKVKRRHYTDWQDATIELRAGSYGQSAPAFTFDVSGNKGWSLCGIQVTGSLTRLGNRSGLANFTMNFSSSSRC